MSIKVGVLLKMLGAYKRPLGIVENFKFTEDQVEEILGLRIVLRRRP